VWGLPRWVDWLQALPRFQQVVFENPQLMSDALTPYVALVNQGIEGWWAFLLAPVSVLLVWTTFRATRSEPHRLIALFGSALLVSPYAMNYELALFAPAVATFLAREQRPQWPHYYAVAGAYGLAFGDYPLLVFLTVLTLLVDWPQLLAASRSRMLDPE
jgi:hypothetical protein